MTNLWKTVFFPYISYVSLFLGMGLISGSIVHMPMDPTRYSIIILVGAVLFAFASFMSDMRDQAVTASSVARSLLFSLLLSVGIGMMSGGIQHFSDNMAYSAMLIPAGLGVSLFSFILKHQIKLNVKHMYAVVLVFLALALPLRVGLTYIADNTWVETGDGGGHGH